MSHFPNHTEFYAFAVHAIYAVILASSFEIARDTFIPFSNINNSDDITHALSVVFVYVLLLSGWLGYTKSISARPHTISPLGSLRFVLDLIIIFFTFYIINLTNNSGQHPIYWTNYNEVFQFSLPLLFVLYVIWDLIKSMEYRHSNDERIININRTLISFGFLALIVIQSFIYNYLGEHWVSVSSEYFIYTLVSLTIVLAYRIVKWDVKSTIRNFSSVDRNV